MSILLTLFERAILRNTTLSEAAHEVDVNQETLKEAVMYRLHVSDTGREYDTDYRRTLRTAAERLRGAN